MDNKQILESLDDIVTFREEPTSEQIEALMEAMDIVEEYSKIGGWIPCSERLPEEKINPVTNDFYEYQVTFKSGKVTDVRHYKFGRGHWWNCGQNMDKYVTAWREPLEAYHG